MRDEIQMVLTVQMIVSVIFEYFCVGIKNQIQGQT